MELVSIIVPVYNVQAYLERCVDSIVRQTYSNLEIILVDDGSPDNCPAICDAWAVKDSRIQVIHKKNGGLSDARNAGVAVATGKFISFIDSDDYIAADFIAKLHAAVEETGADVAECAVRYVNEDGLIIRQRNTAPMRQMDKMEALRCLVMENGISQTVWNKLYREDVMRDIPFAVGKYNEDEFWTYQVFDKMEKLAVVQEPLYNYVQRKDSIIGVGYNICRLDGLEARFQRMEYLQKYEELAMLTRQEFIMDCMWHYQCTISLLIEQEQEQALNFIRGVMEKCPKVPLFALTGKMTDRGWYCLFRAIPYICATIRNYLRIGI